MPPLTLSVTVPSPSCFPFISSCKVSIAHTETILFNYCYQGSIMHEKENAKFKTISLYFHGLLVLLCDLPFLSFSPTSGLSLSLFYWCVCLRIYGIGTPRKAPWILKRIYRFRRNKCIHTDSISLSNTMQKHMLHATFVKYLFHVPWKYWQTTKLPITSIS